MRYEHIEQIERIELIERFERFGTVEHEHSQKNSFSGGYLCSILKSARP